MLTVAEVAEALEGRTIGGPGDAGPVRSVVVDSRQVTPGSLFVALKGQKHDGHDFVAEAFVKGAKAALVEFAPRHPDGADLSGLLPIIQVPDTLGALQRLARYWRELLGVVVVGVTGSVGKTTTKEVVAGVLTQRLRVLKNEGNLNTEIGLPLTLLRATPEDEVVVLEMGMYAAGEIRALARIARPDVGIVTNIGPIHMERLGTIERIADAKAELVEELPREGVAVLNLDDPRVREMASKTAARVLFYGLDAPADFRAEKVQSRGLQGVEFDLRHTPRATPLTPAADRRAEKPLRLSTLDSRRPTADWVHVRMPLIGRHSVHAALAASAAAYHLGLSLEEIAAGLHQVSSSLRLIVVAGLNGSTIVDDTYNASPPSMLAALNLLGELDGRKVAVLGDMLELGSAQEEGHRMVGRRAAVVADVIVVVGALGEIIGMEARASGKRGDDVFLAPTNERAIDQLKAILRPGDCVLVKGSRGVHMEEIIEGIRCPTP